MRFVNLLRCLWHMREVKEDTLRRPVAVRPGIRFDWSRAFNVSVFFRVANPAIACTIRSMSMALDIAAKNVKQSAEFLGVTIGRIYELIRDGRLKATKVSERCWLVETDSLERYAAGDRSPGRRPVQKS